MSSLRNFLKKNLKFHFYLKEHKLVKYKKFYGIYYINKRKGKHRNSLKHVDICKKNIYNTKFWDNLINNENDQYYKTEERRIISYENYFNYKKGVNFKLKIRQIYAVERAKGKVLDIGCFDGKCLCWLKLNGFDCYGIDFGDVYLKVARKNFKKAGGDPNNIVKGLFQKIPFNCEMFDTVISQETLEHFYFPEIMVSEINRILKSGGIFIGSVPLENRIDSETHVIYYELRGVKQLLSRFFDIIEIKEIKNRSTNKENKLIVWQARKKLIKAAQPLNH